MLVSIIAIVTTLLLVIGLHEAGHALAAKLCGVKIQRISVGFGKPLLRWQDKKGCEWVWALWPLGGYVQLLNTRIQPVKPSDYPQCFDKQSVWVRCFILLAGAFVNFLVALIALQFFFMIGHKEQMPVIKTVVPNSIAAKAGIQANDRLLAVAGIETKSWQEVGMQMITRLQQQTVPITLSNPLLGTRDISLDLKAALAIPGKSLLPALGMEPDLSATTLVVHPSESFVEAGKKSLHTLCRLLSFFLSMFFLLITGAIPFSLLLGPLGFLAVSIGSFVQGLSVFLYFIASFSLAVGLVNLFPFPGLDGGSIVYAVVEGIRGKPASIDLEVLLHRLATILFAVVLVQLILNDLVRYFYGH